LKSFGGGGTKKIEDSWILWVIGSVGAVLGGDRRYLRISAGLGLRTEESELRQLRSKEGIREKGRCEGIS
jgi:hypothetical protein